MLEFHELAELFALMDGDEAVALGDDLKANGQLEPIWLYEDKVLDGRNRYLQCIRVGIEPTLRPYLETIRSRSLSRSTSSAVTWMRASVPLLRRSWQTCPHIAPTISPQICVLLKQRRQSISMFRRARCLPQRQSGVMPFLMSLTPSNRARFRCLPLAHFEGHPAA
jgi:hypothetical protein